MESFDMFLNGNFVALPAFQKAYGIQHDGEWVIPTKWQSALFQAGQCGAFIGVFLAGPITNRWGYRWTTIFALILMNATIFISFFVSLPYRTGIDRAWLKLTIHQGQFPHSLGRRPSFGRCAMGILHCKFPRLCQ